MEGLTVIIPARKERYLNQTIYEVITKSDGRAKIIVILDGTDEKRVDGVTYIYNEKSVGMRSSINQAVKIADTKYIMKLDAHCMLDKDFDLKLIKEHQSNWIQIPRRKRLIASKWEIDESKGNVDYMYINKDYMGIVNRTQDREGLIDDTEVFQGSCYFIETEFFKSLGCLDDKNFGGSGFEAIELATKVKRAGGRVIRNKKTWYAHARIGRRYVTSRNKSREYINKFMEEDHDKS